jgi:putative ABC transport system permease protein
VGNAKLLNLFVLIGFFILIIACLNFINLTTAKSVERAKEIGIKKVLGSNRNKLIVQFLTESGMFCITALIISMLAVSAILPLFNSFTGKAITIASLFSPVNILLAFGIIILIIPIAGFYPAIVLSSYQPVKVLKGNFSPSGSGNLLRKGLVVTQFVISIAFILSTIVIWKQMSFMQNQDLGFDKNKIVLVNARKVPWALRNNNANVFKTGVLKHADIQAVSGCWAVPGRVGWEGQFAYPEGKTKEQALIVEYIPVDNDYVKTLGLRLSTGRDFMADRTDDQQKNLVINEAAVKSFGWGNNENAIGKKLSTSGKDGIVIGVLKDYHQHGLQEQIKPVVLGIGSGAGVFAIRYNGADPRSVINTAKDEWNQVFKGYEFDYKFMDEDFQQQYEKEAKFETLFGLAAFLSISIACLGLLGLAIYTAQKRIKEIGVRKVLGASVYNITFMLSKDFLQLVFVAILVACPVAWYAMDGWLQGFAYHISMSWWIFLLAGGVSLLIALITVCLQSIKAAIVNPVKSLRSE